MFLYIILSNSLNVYSFSCVNFIYKSRSISWLSYNDLKSVYIFWRHLVYLALVLINKLPCNCLSLDSNGQSSEVTQLASEFGNFGSTLLYVSLG